MLVKKIERILTRRVVVFPVFITIICAVYLCFFIKETYVVKYAIVNQDYDIALNVMEKESFLEDVYEKVSKEFVVKNYSFESLRDDVKIIGQPKTLMIDVSVKGSDKALAEKIASIIHLSLKEKLKTSLTNSAFYIYNLKEKKLIINKNFLYAEEKYKNFKSTNVIKAETESAIKALAEIQASLELSEDKEDQNRKSSQINIRSLSSEIYTPDNKVSVTVANVMLDYYYWKYINDNFERKVELSEKSQEWQLDRLIGDFKARTKEVAKLSVLLGVYFLILFLFVFIEAANNSYKKDS